MNVIRILPLMLLILGLLLVGCSAAEAPAEPTESASTEPETAVVEEMPADEPTTETDMEAVTEVPVEAPAAENEAATEPDADTAMTMEESSDDMAAVERPAWQTIALTDAQTGAAFTLADFAGKTVFVEPMATWCTNCAAQLRRVAEARQQLNSEDFVFVALSLETNLADSSLATYAQRSGYDWHFAVMSPELLASLIQEFGNPVSSAPSTPHFVIRPDGSFTTLRTGAKSVEQIVSEMQTESGA